MTKTLPITEARANLTNLVDRAKRLLDEYIITVNGKPAAVLVSIKRFEVILQTRRS